ncbi:hypothetical protein FoTM2_000737 [Fusarium oxysporum f. sp. vasinfectum]|nr:hypothetical protein FoTM2_000737 [Fusarium oxysporum f. sp. vasinfectum]
MPDQDSSQPSEFWLYGYGLGMPSNNRSETLTKIDHSEDHRGTPKAPGRVVTLIERSYWEQLTDSHDSAPERVWGVAYRIIPEKVAEVKEYLDIREINGYTIHYAPFHPADGSPLFALWSTSALQIMSNFQGPSGLNKDYLLSLDTALSELAPDSGDHHIHDLARRVRELEKNCEDETKLLNPTTSVHQQKHSTEEAEEIEEPHH